MASLRNALVAHKNIFDIVQETDDLVLEFPFYEKKYKFLSGEKGFNTLRKLSADTNVRIFIPNTENSMLIDGKYSNDASFEGTYPNICKAIELIESHYKKREREPINTSLLGVSQISTMNNIPYDTNIAPQSVQPQTFVHSNSVNNSNHQDNKTSKVAKVKGPPARDPNDKGPPARDPNDKGPPARDPNDKGPPARDPSDSNPSNSRNPKEKLKNGTTESSDIRKVPSQNSNKNKDKVKEEPVIPTEGNEVKEVTEVKELVKLERIIEIPSNIVGIFLARPKTSNSNSPKISVVNQIQKFTHTTISLIDPPPTKVKQNTTTDSVDKPVDSAAESTNGTNDTSENNSRRRRDSEEVSGSDEDGDESDGLEDEEEEGDEGDEKIDEIKSSKDATIDSKEPQPITMVRFTVSNQRGVSRDSIDPLCTQESIDLACTVIARMINGERIKDVLAIFSGPMYKSKKGGKDVGGKNIRQKKNNNTQNNDGESKKKPNTHSKEKNSPKKDTQKDAPKDIPN